MTTNTETTTDDERTYWNIKVYDAGGNERETLRGLTVSRMDTLMRIFDREGVSATAMKFTEEGAYNHQSKSVNPRSPGRPDDEDQTET